MLFLAIVGGYISGERDYLFSMSMRDVSRIRYGENPFVEAPLIAQYIRDHTTADDRIAVLGSEPEIYFYARRKSATGHIYAYPLMESQRYASWMQDETIREIGAANPEYLVFAAVDVSWLRRPESDGRIFAWTAQFTKTCYDMVGIADIYSPQETTMLWDDDVRTFVPHSAEPDLHVPAEDGRALCPQVGICRADVRKRGSRRRRLRRKRLRRHTRLPCGSRSR